MVKKLTAAALVLLVAAGMFGACGAGVGNNGSGVGGPCGGDGDCDSRCLRGGHYPQGTCSYSCNSDDQCPGGTACVDEDGGVCLLRCDRSSDCRGGYSCKGKKRRDKSGDVTVCIE